jgi:hypothetical protein
MRELPSHDRDDHISRPGEVTSPPTMSILKLERAKEIALLTRGGVAVNEEPLPWHGTKTVEQIPWGSGIGGDGERRG